MAKLSRTEKYKDLRESLQNDVGQEIESDDLTEFQNRLNQLAPDHFEAPRTQGNKATDRSASLAHRAEYDNTSSFEDTPMPDFRFSQNSYQNTDTLPTYSNDYLERYINEVKQYNIDRGNAVSEDTQVNILNRIHQSDPDEIPDKPYPNEKRRQPAQERDTTEVPFFRSRSASSEPAYSAPASDTPRNVRDIASQVQELVSNEPAPAEEEEQPFVNTNTRTPLMDSEDFNKHLEMERTTRQQLLNETTQLRAQLDDYEDNLSEVSDKMRHTNQILNIVLLVLIVALVIILALVIYWIVLSNGGNA